MANKNLNKEESLKALEERYLKEMERHCAGYRGQEESIDDGESYFGLTCDGVGVGEDFEIDDIVLPDLFKVML